MPNDAPKTEADLMSMLTDEKPPSAPAAGKTEVIPSPDAGQPKGTQDGQPTADAKVTETNTTDTPTKVTETPPTLDDAAVRASLGLKAKEPETVESLKTKLTASSREAHELVQWRKTLDQHLADSGLKVTKGKDGKFLYVMADEDRYTKYVSKILEGVGDIDLTDDQKELAVSDPAKFAKQIAQKVASEVLNRPRAAAHAADTEMADDECGKLTEAFATAKGPDGKPLYPEYDTLEPYIADVLQSENTPEGFRKWMLLNPENYNFGMKAAYAIVHRAAAPMLAALADKERVLNEKKESAKREQALKSEAGITGKVGADGISDEAREIAGAKQQY